MNDDAGLFDIVALLEMESVLREDNIDWFADGIAFFVQYKNSTSSRDIIRDGSPFGYCIKFDKWWPNYIRWLVHTLGALMPNRDSEN